MSLNQNKQLRTAIVGVSGYTGIELLRLCLKHPNLKISGLFGKASSGKRIEYIYPAMQGQISKQLPIIESLEKLQAKNFDVLFCALPHASCQVLAKKCQQENNDLVIIDLSADFRLHNIEEYEETYKSKHQAKDLQKKAVYGLSEIYPDEVKSSNIIANPGCHSSACLLSLMPIVKSFLEEDSLSIHSITGISGGGSSPSKGFHFPAAAHNVYAYKLDGHRHQKEIEQELSKACQKKINVTFTPIIAPTVRGIFSTVEAKLKPNKTYQELIDALRSFYHIADSFVQVLEVNESPQLSSVIGSNNVHIGVAPIANSQKIRLFSVIDNLVKGASGQAIQNLNIRFDFPIDAGLDRSPLYP